MKKRIGRGIDWLDGYLFHVGNAKGMSTLMRLFPAYKWKTLIGGKNWDLVLMWDPSKGKERG